LATRVFDEDGLFGISRMSASAVEADASTIGARDVGFADIERGRMGSAARSRICATAS
jgi:hypothetical protein